MSDDRPGSDHAEPTVVVGYPTAVPTATTAQANPGMASLRSQVSTLRFLLLACLALLVLLLIGVGVFAAQSRSQWEALTGQVAALSEQANQAEAAAAAAPAPAAPAPKAESVAQLSAAADLPGDLPAGVDSTGALLIGDPNASNVVEVYVDYQCPFCQKWEREIGTSLVSRALMPGSDLLVKHYILAFLGEENAALDPAGASARAGNAAVCVMENDGPATFAAFSQSLFETADPTEPPGQFEASVLVDLAKKAGASGASIECITSERHVDFVAASTKAGFTRGVGGTPTVVVNGTTVGNAFTDAAVLQFVPTT